jgi:hypothetical protein
VPPVERRQHVRQHGAVLAAAGGHRHPLAGAEQSVCHDRLVYLLLQRRVEALAAQLLKGLGAAQHGTLLAAAPA